MLSFPPSRSLSKILAPVLALAALAAVLVSTQGDASALPPSFEEQVVISGLNQPTAMRFSVDGRIFVAEKSGIVKVFDDLADTTPTTFVDLRTNVNDFWDRGLLGMALAPNFPTDPSVYVLYAYDHQLGSTAPAPKWNDGCPSPPGPTTDGCVVSGRLSRFIATGNVAGPEQVLVEDWCQQFPSHSMGDIRFDPDGYLYAGAGDGASYDTVDYGQFGIPKNPCGDPPTGSGGIQTSPSGEGGALRAQDMRTPGDPTGLNGSIIRVDPTTGAAAPTNPNIASTDANAQRIVAYGLRNPFRMTFRPGTSELWIGDVGWNSYDEIDRLVSPTAPTSNFGWPCYEGPVKPYAALTLCQNLYAEGPNAVKTAAFQYDHSGPVVVGDGCPTGSSAITGLAFYTGTSYPAIYRNALFFSDYSRGCVWFIPAGTDGVPDPALRQVFRTGLGIIDIETGPNGDLFFLDLGGNIRRVRYQATNLTPVASVTATPNQGAAPLTVTFEASASTDPDGTTLTYAWDLDNDGAFDDGNGATITRAYTAVGNATIKVRVTDAGGATAVGSVSIAVGNTAPVATITTPTSALRWSVGDAISFSGTGTDVQDGVLAPSRLTWSLVMHHCSSETTCHEHPIQQYVGVASGTFAAPDHQYPSYLELALTVTDAGGLTSSTSVRLDPMTTPITVDSNPTGLQVSVAGTVHTTPFTTDVITGSANSLGVISPQPLGAESYSFVSWSDGGAAQHDVIAPATAQTYTATFSSVAVSGPVLALGFDDAVGATVGDAAVPAHLGTVEGGATWATGRFGGGLHFDGVNGRVIVPDANELDLTTGATVEAWVRPESVASWATAVMKERSGGLAWSLYASGGGSEASAYVDHNGSDAGVGGPRLTVGQWSHLATTFDGTNLRLFINGVLVSTAPVAGTLTVSDGALRIGGNSVWGEWFRGDIDEVRVYQRPLSVAEIATDMVTAIHPTSDTTAPSVPAGFTATGGVRQVALAWTASTDDTAVTGYRVYRSTTTVTPTLANLVATVSTPSFTDTNLAAGTYHYVVTAFDAAGNTSAASIEGLATVTDPPPPTTAPVFAWNMRDYTEAVGFTLTPTNMASSLGRYGVGKSFAQPGAMITVADNAALDLTTAMTLEAWVKPTAADTSWRTVMLKEGTGDLAYALYASGGGNFAEGYVNASGVDRGVGGSTLPVDQWSHLATTYDGTTMRMYVNGLLVGSAAVSGLITASDGALRIGSNSIWGEQFTGDMDELRIYNRAISAAEISVDMNTPIDESVTGAPTIRLPFDTATATSTPDTSGNGLDATIEGATLVDGGHTGKAMSFDGTGSSLVVPYSALLDRVNAFTVMAWVKPAAGTDWRTVAMRESGSGFGWALYGSGGGGFSETYVRVNGTEQGVGGPTLTANQWSHLAMTYDGTTLKLYVNGVAAGTKTVGGGLTVVNGALRIGGNSIWGEWYQGLIDDFLLTDIAMTPAQITAAMAG